MLALDAKEPNTAGTLLFTGWSWTADWGIRRSLQSPALPWKPG